MNNAERYRRAFSKVHAPQNAAQRALERLEAGDRPQPRRQAGKLRRMLVLAAVLVLLSISVHAELANGAVSNLLAPLYGGSQTELVDSIGHPVGAAVTVNGYTLTADAVIGDRYNIAVVYTLTREDGQPIPEGVCFDQMENSMHRGSGGGSYSIQRGEELPENQVQIVETWTSSTFLFQRRVHVTFQDLKIYHQDTESYTDLADGCWELDFLVRYRDTTISVPVKDLTVTGDQGNEYQIRKIQISPLSIHMDLKASPNSLEDGLSEFQVELRRTDGSFVTFENRNFGGGGDLDAPTIRADYGAFFEQPIPLEEMDALLICGVEVPVSVGG